MMLVVLLCFIVHTHTFSRNQSPTTPSPPGSAGKPSTFPPGPAHPSGPLGKVPAPPSGPANPMIVQPVDSHDKLDEISRLVLGYTFEELLYMTSSDRDQVFTGHNLVQEQFMLTKDWISLNVAIDYLPHVEAFYEMILQWLEDAVHGVKTRERVKKEMIREWKKMHDGVKIIMKARFIGFQLLDEMANAT